MSNRNVAIIGATDSADKYAYRALKSLESHEYVPFPVNPTKDSVGGYRCYHSLAEIPEPIDTVTMYVRPEISAGMLDDLLAKMPRRVIMNPGAVNDALAEELEKRGIQVVHACTLVMLASDQF